MKIGGKSIKIDNPGIMPCTLLVKTKIKSFQPKKG